MVAQLTNEYKIDKGITDKQIDQLINHSETDEGLKYTSDQKRFKDRSSFDEFSKEILAYYALVDDRDNLLGIIWFHDLPIPVIPAPDQVRGKLQHGIQEESSIGSRIKSGMTDSDYGISFAIRLYGEARGKGLALPFTQKVMEDFKNSDEYKNHPHKKFWLSVSPENEPAVSLYRKLGFKDLERNREYNKLLMILD